MTDIRPMPDQNPDSVIHKRKVWIAIYKTKGLSNFPGWAVASTEEEAKQCAIRSSYADFDSPIFLYGLEVPN